MAYSLTTQVDRLLQKAGLEDIKPHGTPMIHRAHQHMTKGGCPTSEEEIAACDEWRGRYTTLVCAGLWLAIYAPEISFAVAYLARFLKNPGPKMWGAAKIFAGYLKSRRDLRYYLRRSSPGAKSNVELKGEIQQRSGVLLSSAADAPHNGNGDGATTIGYLLKIGDSVVLARALKLKHVTLSTNESELSAQTECGRDVLSVRFLLSELGLEQRGPTTMECDSHGAIAVADRRSPTHRTKHIRLRDMWIRQLVANGHAKLIYTRAESMLADPLSKAAPGPLFSKTRTRLLLLPEVSTRRTLL